MDSAARPVVDPLVVGKAFISQYYNILYNMPEHLHRFYQEISKVGRIGQDGVMRNFSTLQGISEELKKLTYGDFKSAEIISYDTQESQDGGFLLVVTGYFSLKESLRRKFTQTFFLAPQENGYFVLNDILRFDVGVVSGNDFNKPSAINGNKGSDQAACVSVKPVSKEVSKPLNNENAKEDVLVPEIVNKEVPDIEITRKEEIVNKEVPDIEVTRKEVADDSPKSCDPEDGHEDVPKKSYASVLKVVKGKSGVSAGSLPSPKQLPKEEEHQVSSAPCPEPILKDPVQQASSDPSPLIESEAVSETVDAAENGHNQEFEVVAEGTSIYVKHLPTNATIDMLETEFKQFGAIGSGGIQVVSQRGLGYPYGFVEFEEADAAQRALEASPIMIGGQKAFVEEKRSTARGNNNRGSGNGYGNRNVGGRGRGSYGPYGYGNNNYRRGGGGRAFNRRGNEYVASINSY